MLGGLKTTSRIAVAAALGLTLGGYITSTPAKAADYGSVGGDCCADLEERVAELEATTVRKGNKKVSVTLSGWVVKTMNWWNDGDSGNFAVGDKDYDLGSRFNISGSATIAPGWSGGYNLTVITQSNVFGFGANQFVDTVPVSLFALYSYMYLKSDTYGTLNWGSLSPASDNAAVLADISGTVIESNGPWFEGPGFFMRPSGNNGLTGLAWGSFLGCAGLGAGIGVDCWGAAQPAVRYDTPTFGGFRVETSYGTNAFSGSGVVNSSNNNFWDIAAFYNNDWGDFKISAAYSYTWIETAIFTGNQSDLHQAGATLMHVPTGLGVYGMFQYEDAGGAPTTDAWYLKPFIKRTWNALGATVLYGEYAQYNDQYASLLGTNMCTPGFFGAGTNIGGFCGAAAGNAVTVTGSEMERWGLGVVQEIDSAAMHVFGRWQHQEADIDFVGTTAAGASRSVNQGFENWDVFQVGGIIFF